MVSIDNSFILISPPKTGSTSLVLSLMEFCDVLGVVPERKECFQIIDPFMVFTRGSKHCGMNNIYRKWDAVYPNRNIDNFLKIGSVRNPWDRMLSLYLWTRPNIEFDNKRFNTFLRNSNYLSYLDYFNYKKECVIDEFIRFETFNEDFNRICGLVGLDAIPLSNINKTNHTKYVNYYDDEGKDLVYSKYKNDIYKFGYSFEL